VFAKKSNGAIIGSLVLAVFLWGGNNAGTKYLVATWPPVWIGCTRFLFAGLLMLGMMRWTRWLGPLTPLSPPVNRDLWLRGALTLAVYIIVFNLALNYTSASHVALYLGTSPAWTLLWEERPAMTWRSAQRYGAVSLAFAGVLVLSWPSLRSGTAHWLGEAFGLATSMLWAVFGRQSRFLGTTLSGAEVSAHTMWRAGLILIPVAIVEVAKLSLKQKTGLILARSDFWQAGLIWVQVYCIIGGGVMAYALWNDALRHWKTSQVFLFNNLIPLSTMAWAWLCLKEPITPTFWLAMMLIVAGVALGQARWA
jgi:drug/metabolite transporter (DMT)-like permease